MEKERGEERDGVTRERREKTEGGLVWCVRAVYVFFFLPFSFCCRFFIPGKCFQVQVMLFIIDSWFLLLPTNIP